MVTTDQSSRPVLPPPGWSDPAPVVAATSWRRWLPLLAWVAALVAGLALLLVLGDGRLAAPPLADPGAWPAWASGRDPLEVTMVVLRLLALGVAWYLVGVTSVSVVARALRAARLVRFADALSVGPIRVLAQQALGVGLAAGVLVSTVPAAGPTVRAAGATRTDDVAVMVALEADQPPVPAPGVETMHELPDARPDATVTSTAPGAVATATTDARADGDRADRQVVDARVREVRVAPGDHFWGLAEAAVADHLGRPGTDAEVLAHWEATVTANADRLVVAGNPDLLVPGQLVVLPEVATVLP